MHSNEPLWYNCLICRGIMAVLQLLYHTWACLPTQRQGVKKGTTEGKPLMKMPKENLDRHWFAPCGMHCKVCYRHCAHQKPCMGCLASEEDRAAHCRSCNIRDCAQSKAVLYCFLCPAFPCKRVKALDASYRKSYGVSLIENSRLAQTHGLEGFLALQKETYTCPRCGGVISMHDGICSECREKRKI